MLPPANEPKMAAMTSTDASESFQLSVEEAEAYETDFVPAFFSQWAPLLCTAADVAAGQRVLDVACGTGIVARTAANTTGAVNVVGVDLNEAMLAVARRVRPDVDWRQADVVALPFADESFDVVLCQMALMFFPDRATALGEMSRVTTHGGTVAVLVPAGLAAQPVYGPLVDMITRHAGAEARSLLDTYFACGDLETLVGLFDAAGLQTVTTRTIRGTARYPSIEAAVATEINSTPLGQRITSDIFKQIVADGEHLLAPYITSDGALEAPFDSHIAAAVRP
jgi:ubiquinone/menaquinone biosynthesis C-methylase UbiE